MCGQGKKEKSGEKTENRSFAVERKMILWCPAPLKGNMQPNRSVGKGERFFWTGARAGRRKSLPFCFSLAFASFFPAEFRPLCRSFPFYCSENFFARKRRRISVAVPRIDPRTILDSAVFIYETLRGKNLL